MRVCAHILPIYEMLKVIMQLLSPLSDVFVLGKAEKSFSWQLGKLWILCSQVTIQCIELREALPQGPSPCSQLDNDLVECYRLSL
jgi:hypothetical protein